MNQEPLDPILEELRYILRNSAILGPLCRAAAKAYLTKPENQEKLKNHVEANKAFLNRLKGDCFEPKTSTLLFPKGDARDTDKL